jgi:hypothetical protein
MADRGKSTRLLFAAATALCLLAPSGALAQTPQLPALRVLPPACEGSGGGDEIVVCANRERRSRFRVPEEPDTGFDPAGTVESVARERSRLAEPGAASGIGSCTNIGPGGFTGCRAQQFRRDIEQYGGEPPSLRNSYRRRRR